MRKSIYIHSCHATLEYDTASMLVKCGYHVRGNFDTTSVERPKIEGVTDVVDEDVTSCDAFILHQVPDFPEMLLRLNAELGGRPVILHAFGQGAYNQHERVAEAIKSFCNLYVVAYSMKDYNTYAGLGVNPRNLRLIRFGKDIETFQGWRGILPVCFISCNSFQDRGDGCGLGVFHELKRRGLPILLGGRFTEKMGGMGQLPYEGLRNMYRNVRCYLALGTVPAPMTLTLIEAMCAGCPVVAYDNGAGVTEEELGVLLGKDIDELEGHIKDMLRSMDDAERVSYMVSAKAREFFDVNTITDQWDVFLKEILT